MSSTTQQAPASKVMYWAGWVLSILPVLMLLGSAVGKFVKPEGMKEVEYPESVAVPLGIVELTCAILYVVPRTTVLGAILLTGYLGGAVASHVRLSEPQFIIPAILGVVIWLGIFLREPRLRALLPLRS